MKEGAVCLAFTRYKGVLSDRILKTPQQIIRVGLDACDILRYLEDINIIHGDIKPDNFCVTDDRRHVVLIDFGSHICLKPTALQKSKKQSKTIRSRTRRSRHASLDDRDDISSFSDIVDIKTEHAEYTTISSHGPESGLSSSQSSEDEDSFSLSQIGGSFGVLPNITEIYQAPDNRFERIGTKGYQAPEGPVDFKYDIFSLGIVLRDLCIQVSGKITHLGYDPSAKSQRTCSSSSSSSSSSNSSSSNSSNSNSSSSNHHRSSSLSVSFHPSLDSPDPSSSDAGSSSSSSHHPSAISSSSSSSSYFRERRGSGNLSDSNFDPSDQNLLNFLETIAADCYSPDPSRRPTAFKLQVILSNLLKHQPSVLL